MRKISVQAIFKWQGLRADNGEQEEGMPSD